MNKKGKMLCRAGVIAALYVALTYAFSALSYQGFLQIRPAEALTVLPLLFFEAVPALTIGCALSNLFSPFLLYDVIIGSLTTMTAALITYFVGRFVKQRGWKIGIGGLAPIILNSFLIPIIIVFLCGDNTKGTALATYLFYVCSMFVTESIWVYGLGTPLYFSIEKLKEKNISFFE